MFRSFSCSAIAVLFLLFAPASARSAEDFSDIPRVDVHAHVGALEQMPHYLEVRKVIKDEFNIDLALWINVSSRLGHGDDGWDYLKEVEEKYNGRFLTCLTNHRINMGIKFTPEELTVWQSRGVVGFKIWVGKSTAIDHPANDPAFTKMEQIGMIGASIHIAQPYPRNETDPVNYWACINAWERVLDRHPDLKVVNAHMMDIFYSDEQLEYLQYFLETYPNVSVDIAARFKDFYAMKTENIRNFVIKYQDRILFGTDIGRQPASGNYREVAELYNRCFMALEKKGTLPGGFFGDREIEGIALPREVLEKIYYRNAVRIYPRVGEVMKKLGYSID
ncbi:amidohydrolase family protein [candidate division KSB1 bacterium]